MSSMRWDALILFCVLRSCVALQTRTYDPAVDADSETGVAACAADTDCATFEPESDLRCCPVTSLAEGMQGIGSFLEGEKWRMAGCPQSVVVESSEHLRSCKLPGSPEGSALCSCVAPTGCTDGPLMSWPYEEWNKTQKQWLIIGDSVSEGIVRHLKWLGKTLHWTDKGIHSDYARAFFQQLGQPEVGGEVTKEQVQVLADSQHLKTFDILENFSDFGMMEYRGGLLRDLDIQAVHIPVNGQGSRFGARCLDEWVVDPSRWDLISFNFGLHDMSLDAERLEVGEYKTTITKIGERLSTIAPQAMILFSTTTPVPVGAHQKKVADPKIYNRAAISGLRSLQNQRISTIDLYSDVVGVCGEEFGTCPTNCDQNGLGNDCFTYPHDVHFTRIGYEALSKTYLNAAAQATGMTIESFSVYHAKSFPL